MSEQVRRLAKLAEELLDLSRLDAGRIRVAREPLDLAEVAEVTVEEFAGVAKATSHPLELARNGTTPALGDEERALQIARILVENALVHTPPETLVRISAAVRDGRAVLEVEDEGPGIDPEDVQHLFDRFYRGGGTKASGSGLGLAIAKELAEVMDGEIELETRAGRTVFTLALPRHDP
jgi:two-component system OmpR family sensor kinase